MPLNIQPDTKEEVQVVPYPENSNQPTSRPTLPVEIIDMIMDHLDNDVDRYTAREALLSASLSSRTLCMRVYQHIFSTLHLELVRVHDNHDGAEATSTLLKLLHETLVRGLAFPGLSMVYYLRSVEITLKFNRRETIPLLDSFCYLPEVLQAFHGPNHGITSLRFEVNTKTRTGTVVIAPIYLSEKRNPKFSKAFFTLCQSSRLKTLYLAQVGLFSRTLRYTRIENIHLRQVVIEDDPEDTRPVECFIVRPTSLTLISTRRFRRLLEPTKYNPTLVAPEDIYGLEITDPVEFFLPSYQMNKSLAHLRIFADLTNLTLLDRDRGRLHLDLLPNLQRLNIVQWLTLHSVSRFGYSGLHSFFISPLGVVRNLGSTKRLSVATDVLFPMIFMNDNHHDEKSFSFSQLKPTRKCWQDVDLHLTSTGAALDQIDFTFRFLLKPEEDLPLGYTELAFAEENRRLIAAYFPRLSKLHMFSLDVLVEKRAQPEMMTQILEFGRAKAKDW